MRISNNIYIFAYEYTNISFFMKQIMKYKTIEPNKLYEIWVSALVGNSTEYRVSVIEECECKSSETVDVNLRRPSDRRFLEDYVEKMKKMTHIKSILFGNGCCINDLHYPLKKYKEIYGHWKGMDFLNDLNIAV